MRRGAGSYTCGDVLKAVATIIIIIIVIVVVVVIIIIIVSLFVQDDITHLIVKQLSN